MSGDDFDSFVNVHFKGVVFLTQKALTLMNEGGVVFITAAADRYNVSGYATYAACKGGVEVFSRYVAQECGPRGIRANTVAPGGIVTDFNNAAIRSNPKAQEWIIAQTLIGRLGEAHDIGDLVALLCSEETRWLTGQRLEATGGSAATGGVRSTSSAWLRPLWASSASWPGRSSRADAAPAVTRTLRHLAPSMGTVAAAS